MKAVSAHPLFDTSMSLVLQGASTNIVWRLQAFSMSTKGMFTSYSSFEL